MELESLKREVLEANLELVRRKLVIYTWGNVSVIDRERRLVIIKPRGIAYEEMDPDDMCVVDMDGVQMEGKLLPSVDLDIHMAIYRRFPQVGAIAHTHSTYATAWAQARRDIPVYGTTHADHFCGPIPCTRDMLAEEVTSDYEKNTGDLVVNTLLERGLEPDEMFGVLVAGHGPFTWGSTAESAVENSVILEELAKMALLTERLDPRPMPLRRYMLEKHFCRKHGSDAYFYQSK